MQLSAHLTSEECKCPDCGCYRMDPLIVSLFEQVREKAGNHPIHINSAFRCKEHNKTVGGERNSRHLLGMAMDMTPPDGLTPEQFKQIIETVPFFTTAGGIGLYDTFCHMDCRSEISRWDFRSN